MELKELNLIRGYLPKGRTKYYYFKDRYAFQMLAWKLGKRSIKVHELKKHAHLRRFLQLPRFKQFLMTLPDGVITAERLMEYGFETHKLHRFRLTVGRWGDSGKRHDSWYQTSRPGWNLVLQLNFSAEHDRCYGSLCEDSANPFLLGAMCHPVLMGPRYTTMAWTRIDLDMLRGIAVIEEIQNDWLRDALFEQQALLKSLKGGKVSLSGSWSDVPVRKALMYFKEHIQPMQSLWDEAMLSAALWFLYEELEVSMVYFHTWESGLWFKQLNSRYGPPRSLYTKLPSRFGFHRVPEGPRFIEEQLPTDRRSRQRQRSRGSYHWWRTILSRLE